MMSFRFSSFLYKKKEFKKCIVLINIVAIIINVNNDYNSNGRRINEVSTHISPYANMEKEEFMDVLQPITRGQLRG